MEQMKSQHQCVAVMAIFFLVCIVMLCMTISLPQTAHAADKIQTKQATSSDDKILADMIHRWFGPLFASTTRTRINMRPQWFIDLHAKNAAVRLSPSGKNPDGGSQKNTGFLGQFGINTFGSPSQSSETFHASGVFGWWNGILDFLRRLWNLF